IWPGDGALLIHVAENRVGSVSRRGDPDFRMIMVFPRSSRQAERFTAPAAARRDFHSSRLTWVVPASDRCGWRCRRDFRPGPPGRDPEVDAAQDRRDHLPRWYVPA